MSAKTELLNIFSKYQKIYEKSNEDIKTIRESSAYTDSGKEHEISKILGNLSVECANCHDKAISTIDAAMESLKREWQKGSSGKLSDAGYQIGLSNTLKMLEMGAISSEDDIKNIVETYKDDYNALSAIRKIASDNFTGFESAKILSLLPEDNRDKNINLLNELKDNIDRYINPQSFPTPAGATAIQSLQIYSLTNSVQELFDDKLKLI